MDVPNAAPAAPAAAPSAPSAATPSAPSQSSSSPSASRKPMTPTEFSRSFNDVGNANLEDLSPAEQVVHDMQGDDEPSEETSSPEEEISAEPEAEDYSWAEPYKAYKDGIHGVQAAELLKALQEGRIPDALLDKLRVQLKDGDDVWEESLSEARGGAMRRHKWQQKMNEVAQERATFGQEKGAWDSERNDFIQYVRSWKEGDVDSGLRGMRKVLGEERFDQIARAYASEVMMLEEMEQKIPGSSKVYKEKARLEQELETQRLAAMQAQREAQRYQQEHTQGQTQQQSAQYQQAVSNHANQLFAEMGLKVTKGSWAIFNKHITANWPEGTQPTAQMVREAVLDTKSEVDYYLAQHREANATPKPMGLPKSSQADAGKPKVTPQSGPSGKRKPMTPAEFAKSLKG